MLFLTMPDLHSVFVPVDILGTYFCISRNQSAARERETQDQNSSSLIINEGVRTDMSAKQKKKKEKNGKHDVN